MLPFLAVPLGAAYRKVPIATLALAGISAATMGLATIAGPILNTATPTEVWLKRLELGHFRTPDVTVVLFGVFVLLAIVAAVLATKRPRVTRVDLELTALAVGSWLAIRAAGPALLAKDLSTGHIWGLTALVVFGAVLATIITRVARGNRLAVFAGIPLMALAARSVVHETTLAFALVAISLVLLVGSGLPGRMTVKRA
jgi:hypothetical protein